MSKTLESFVRPSDLQSEKGKKDGRWFEATNVTSRRKLPVTSAAALAVVVHA
jgi:hypothetical protein